MQSGNKAERLHQQFCVNLSSFKPSFLQLIVAFSIYCLTLRNGGSTKGPSLVHVEMLVAQIYFRLHLRILKRFVKTRRSWLVGGLVLTYKEWHFVKSKVQRLFRLLKKMGLQIQTFDLSSPPSRKRICSHLQA